jgi:hypothetical protein
VYTDAECAVWLAEEDIFSTEPEKCSPDLVSGDLRGMSATWLTHDPGSCEPLGGEPTGEVTPVDPATFCCIAAR